MDTLKTIQQFTILRYEEVPFYNDKILGAHTILGGGETIFVPIGHLCQILGLTTKKQINRIKTDKVLAEGSKEIMLPSKGGSQKTFCLQYDLLPMWLTTVQVNKVRPEFQEKILLYRKEVAKILADYFLGVPVASVKTSTETSQFISQVVSSAVKSAICEISGELIQQTVKITMAEIDSHDPLYLASKKLSIAERLHALTPLTEEEISHIKSFIMGTTFPGFGSNTLAEKKLTHAAEFLHEKSLRGYTWTYKTHEAAAAQLSKEAKKLWEADGYTALKEPITLKSGRTVEVYIFHTQYGEKALDILVGKGKIIPPSTT